MNNGPPTSKFGLANFVANNAARGHYLGMAVVRDEILPTRASLLVRLKDWQDQSSWQEFFDTYWKLIYGVARRSGLTDTEAQDAVQETMLMAAKHLPSFKYDPATGSFKGWLLNATRWKVIDQIRKRRQRGQSFEENEERGMSVVAEEQTNAALDGMWDEEWQRSVMEAAIDRVKRKIDPVKYQIFDFYVRKEWAPQKVAERFGVSTNEVYLAKHRITQLIQTEAKRLEKEGS